jgi:hypothetical protein
VAAGAAEFVPVDAGVAAAAAEGGDGAAGAELQRPNGSTAKPDELPQEDGQRPAQSDVRNYCSLIVLHPIN